MWRLYLSLNPSLFSSMKFHTGDTVVVITGKDKGKTGTIMRVLPEDQRVVVAGINMRTRHIKKTFQEAGRIIHYEATIHASNVMLVDPKTKKRSRIGYKVDEKGMKKRVSKASGEEVVKVRAKATPKKTAKKTDTDDVETKKTKKTSAESDMPPKKSQPFWKKMGFSGGNPSADTGAETSARQDDHSAPEQAAHVRGGSARGS